MGWKASSIIIKTQSKIDNDTFLSDLGFTTLSKTEDKTFDVAINPDDNKLYIGYYNNNLIITAPEIPMLFFENSLSTIEKILIDKFPESEICSIVLHSVVNLWGYALIVNGEKIRVRAGSANDGTFCDFGEIQEEEKELFSKSTIDSDGKRTYKFDDMPDEIFYEDQVGENYVFALTQRFFGKPLDYLDDIFDLEFNGYDYSLNKYYQYEPQNTKQKNKWWKFW
jgi:hypothetical protein